MSDESAANAPEDGGQLWQDIEQDQLRALKRLDADADGVALADGFGMPLAPRGTDPLADLTRALARDLIAAGFEIHDCADKAPGGGVCLTPGSNAQGVIVTWTQHDAAEAAFGYGRQSDLQEHMNYALAEVLTMIGYPVEGFGQATAHLVTGPRMVDHAAGDDEPAGEGDQ